MSATFNWVIEWMQLVLSIKDAEGNNMTAEQITAFLGTLT